MQAIYVCGIMVKAAGMFYVNKKYLFLTLALLVTEVIIVLFVHDGFIRSYVGDFLVVILIYCFLQTFSNFSAQTVAFSVLIFAYALEGLQYFNWLHRLGWQRSALATIVLGNSFAWADVLAYTLGIMTVIWLEKIGRQKN